MRHFPKYGTPKKFLVHLVYCESGIETEGCPSLLQHQSVHLVYCESGIETSTLVFLTTSLSRVHLVYCESGIETFEHEAAANATTSSFSLLRERY